MKLVTKSEVIRFRAEERHVDKVMKLMTATGLDSAELMRRLIDNAQVAVVTRSEAVATLPARSVGGTNAAT